MKRIGFVTVSFSCWLALALFIPCSAAAAVQNPDTVWAQPQQAALAEEILGCDGEQCWDPVFVAEALGSSRMSEDVRIALLMLLERFLDDQDVASAQDIPLQYVVDGEFFLNLAGMVADFEDPRSIPILVRVGNYGYSRIVERGLASFGEDALHAIVDFMDSPAANDDGISSGLHTLAMMIENGEVNGFSASARAKLGRVARESLHSPRSSESILYGGIALSLALNEPDLVQTVKEFSQDDGALAARGFSQGWVDMIRRSAAELLDARAPDGL